MQALALLAAAAWPYLYRILMQFEFAHYGDCKKMPIRCGTELGAVRGLPGILVLQGFLVGADDSGFSRRG